MANRLTINGVNQKVVGLEKVVDVRLKNIQKDIGEMKKADEHFKENDFAHMRTDIEALKKFRWQLSAIVGAIIVASQILVRVLF